MGAVGVDETAFTAATATRPTEFVTGIVDLTRRSGGVARLLDIVQNRSAEALSSWIAQREPGWRASIAAAPLDPYLWSAAALRTGLPAAPRVLDSFHVTHLGFAAVDEVRRRIQRLLRRGDEHHSERSWARLLAGLDAGDRVRIDTPQG